MSEQKNAIKLAAAGNETLTNCECLKMQAKDGKTRPTEVAVGER